jgi:predicted patatin/cPLA2 family phospholipase
MDRIRHEERPLPSPQGATRPTLVVQGGGLRGAYAVGVIRVLHEYAGPEAFETIVAVSSGVFAASYFLADQPDEMENTWRDLVCGEQLVNYRNFFARRPVLGLDYLIGLFQGKVLLHVDRILKSSTKLVFVMTDYTTGQPAYFDARRPDIFDLMRASAALPRLYPLPVRVDERPFYDGGHSDPIPVQHALSLGRNTILAILTRPLTQRKSPPSRLLGHLLLRGSDQARREWLQLHHRYNGALDLLANPPSDTTVHTIAPTVTQVSRLTRDRATLIRAIEQGKADAHAFLAREGKRFFPAVA